MQRRPLPFVTPDLPTPAIAAANLPPRHAGLDPASSGAMSIARKTPLRRRRGAAGPRIKSGVTGPLMSPLKDPQAADLRRKWPDHSPNPIAFLVPPVLFFLAGGQMMRTDSMAVAAAILLATVSFGYSSDESARAAKTMYSAWLCSTYAELKGDTAEQGRLFMMGHEKGKEFIGAVLAGTINGKESRTIVPMTVVVLMGGPTHDFILGRIFQNAAGQAYDDIATKDANGVPFPPADYVTDDELMTSIASTKYSRANCEVLR